MKHALTFVAVPALAISLAACGDNDSGDAKAPMPGHSMSASASPSDGGSQAQHNEQDVMFAQMMIPHHQQAIEMSDILLANDGAMPEVASLAEEIKDAQAPEIDTLTSWLTEWGADPAEEMDHGDMSTDSGMMSEEDLANLESATGPEVNRLFLEQMIMHHEGAIAMAQDQVDNGQNPDAIALAENIIATQEEEIATMGSILGTLNDTTH